MPAKDGAEALEIHTVLRLISGGTAGAAVCKKLVKTGDNRYRYGELDILIHQTNFRRGHDGCDSLPAEEFPRVGTHLPRQARKP